MRPFAAIGLSALLLTAGAALGGCNTVRGAGEDVASLGTAVEHGASKTENMMFGGSSSQPASTEEQQQNRYY